MYVSLVSVFEFTVLLCLRPFFICLSFFIDTVLSVFTSCCVPLASPGHYVTRACLREKHNRCNNRPIGQLLLPNSYKASVGYTCHAGLTKAMQ